MKILMSGSGSGGHVIPCIRLYNELKNYYEIDIVAFKNIDKKIYDLNNIKYYFIDNEVSSMKKIKFINDLFNEHKYNIFITFGGKNSIYVDLIAKIHNKKYFLFEQNFHLGKANLLLYPFCENVFSGIKLNKNYKKELNYGNPSSIIKEKRKIKLFNNDKKTILFSMGSQGAFTVNNVIEQFINNNKKKYNYIIISGTNVKSTLKENENIKVYEFYNPLTDLIYSCDIYISRAGATSISEVISLNKPTIFIPSPFVSNNHQEKNIIPLYKNKACLFILEKDLNINSLANKINILLNEKNYLEIKTNLREFKKSNIIYNIKKEFKKYENT